MANNLSAFNPEYWSKRMQVIRFKIPVYMKIASMEERSLLKDGDTVHRPYRSRLVTQNYTRGTDVSIQDVSATDETLVVNTAKIVPFYVDDLDRIQNKWDTANKFADDAGTELELTIDADVLGEVVNADYTVDDGDVGGTAGTAITLTTSNVLRVFAAAAKKLNRGNITMADRFAVISPTTHQLLVEYLAGKDTNVADRVGENGYVGRFQGFELYLSNQTYYSATWTPANNPTNNDTITINGVTFTFVSSIGSTAGNVLIGGTLADTLDNLVTLIGDLAATTATGVAVSADSQRALAGLSITDNATNVTLQFEGAGEIDVAASEANDPWSAQTVHLMFGQKGAVDLVVQKQPNVVFKDVPTKLGRNVMPWTLYGLKTFQEGGEQLVDVQLDATSF